MEDISFFSFTEKRCSGRSSLGGVLLLLLLLLGNNLVLGDGLGDDALLLGLGNSDVVGEGALGTDLAGGIPREHDLNLQTKDTLAKEDVADSVVNVVLGGLTRVNQVAVRKLHCLSAGGTELAGHDDLTTLGSSLHDEAENTIAGPEGVGGGKKDGLVE